MFTEPQEIEKRKTNVIIKGIPEKVESLTDDEICIATLKQINIDHTPKEITRLGKVREDGNPRNLRLTFENEKAKSEVLENARQLRNCKSDLKDIDFKKIYISPDLTIIQREQAYNRRQKRRLQAEKTADDPQTQKENNTAPDVPKKSKHM